MWKRVNIITNITTNNRTQFIIHSKVGQLFGTILFNVAVLNVSRSRNLKLQSACRAVLFHFFLLYYFFFNSASVIYIPATKRQFVAVILILDALSNEYL